MKKLSLFCLASLWLICSPALRAQNQGVDFYVFSSQRVRSVENNLQYLFHPFAATSFKISGASNLENRLSFNQESKFTMLNLDFSLENRYLLHRLTSDYQTQFDASDLEPSPYVNKTATLGYSLALQASDSLSLELFSRGIMRHEQDRYVSDMQLSSQGFWIGSNARTALSTEALQAGLSGSAERKKLAWETFDLGVVNAYCNLYDDTFTLDSRANYSYRDEDIYILMAPDGTNQQSYYELSDQQLRRSLGIGANLSLIPWEYLQVQLGNEYSQKHTSYSQCGIRNNADYYNLAQTNVTLQLHPRLNALADAVHTYAIKDYRNKLNTRHTETRHLGSRIAWEYADSDSLIATTNVELQIIKFPNDANRWDNDLLTRNYRLGWKHYWKERIRLATWLGYSEREDVYTDSLLSANNKIVTTYSIYPECRILFGDRLAFNQSYQLRADYSDYIYNTGKENTFYRQVGYRYNLVFDTFPLIARSQDPRWLKLPYRNSPYNALLLDFGFAYEENQYASQKTDFYQLNTKNRRWTGSFGLRHDIRSFYWSVTPKYSWGTWQEYSAQIACAWEFNNASQVELTVSPYGENLDSIDWRSAISLNLRF